MRGINKIDDLVEDCINDLSDERVDLGVEALYELASAWKTVGLDKESWLKMCQHIEKQATLKSEETFVQIKIQNALIKIREQKNGIILMRPLH